MTLEIHGVTKKLSCFALSHFFFFLLLSFSFSVGSALASTDSKVSFAWQANPADEYVIGYRLYYGAKSRYNPNGSLKNNFSYDYYIDFADQTRCSANNSNTPCESLSTQELQCLNLYQNSPKCTVSMPSAKLFFALTACNAQQESSFTHEINADLTALPQPLITAHINILLLSKK